MILLLLALFWAGLLVIRFIAPMIAGAGEEKKGSLGPRSLVPLAVITVAGFLFDQWIHGRFL